MLLKSEENIYSHLSVSTTRTMTLNSNIPQYLSVNKTLKRHVVNRANGLSFSFVGIDDWNNQTQTGIDKDTPLSPQFTSRARQVKIFHKSGRVSDLTLQTAVLGETRDQ